MSETMILRIKDLPVHARGDGVETTLIAGKDVCGSRITTGLTSFPPGKEVPVHKHNCDEQVTLIEGEAVVEIEGERSEVNVMDTTDGVIMISLEGGCTGCSATPMTAMQIYYSLMKIDEVQDVIFVNGELPAYMRSFIDDKLNAD